MRNWFHYKQPSIYLFTIKKGIECKKNILNVKNNNKKLLFLAKTIRIILGGDLS